ncbi:hypothetical protein NQ318_013252 [Aromia moschata]|uniref:Cysteine proteinase n=1 Tax=Aromia moschata TaxID=1265417 RepID=A0AAV8XS82_9CUCU|nr:hypothetical protein NQ318_013252 [Aromia moschata]
MFLKFIFLALFCCCSVYSTNPNDSEQYAPHITAVLNYLNSNPNRVYEYSKGVLVNAQQKADIIELTLTVDVTCIVNSQYLDVPCTERQLTCRGFIQRDVDANNYKVLSDVPCEPKRDVSAEDTDELATALPFASGEPKTIELSHEAVSSEQKADFVAVKVNRVPCLGCPFELNTDAEGVSTLVDTALRHVETERAQKHAIVKVIRLQQQVVAGIKYILLVEIAPTVCQKDVDLSSSNCPVDDNAYGSVCEVIFIQQPWISKAKNVIKNNCTVSQEYKGDREVSDKVNNSDSENGNNDVMSPDSLADLESQILPVEDEKNKPVTENTAKLDVNNAVTNNDVFTKDQRNEPVIENGFYRINEANLKAVNLKSNVEETGTSAPVADNVESQTQPEKLAENHGCTDNHNGNNNVGDGVTENGNIELNIVKRSTGVLNIQQNDRPASENERKRYRRDHLVGAPAGIALNDSRVLHFTDSALTELDKVSEHPNKYKVIDIISATSQVVAGAKYTIKVKISLSDCPKNEPTSLADCGFLQDERPWLQRTQTTVKCDDSDQEYTFEKSPEKTKRSIFYDDGVTVYRDSGRGKRVSGMFQNFMAAYGKIYADETEYAYRLKVFKDNLNTINLLNKYEQGTARYGITQFADLTGTEFSKSHGLRTDLRHENHIPFLTAATPDVALPTEFDWRDKGVVTKVKNQGSCGSCWAFSTTGNVEGQYAIKHGKLVEFSEQELVDCDKLDEGCNGGLMDNAYRSIEEIGGLESESDYPYDARDEKCHFSKAKVQVQIASALNISHNETDMAKWLVKNGPISIAINANAMQFYMGGVSHPWKVLCDPNNLDHGVLIVGYGVHTYTLFNKTLPYWIVKNSWGSSWGEQGYYRVYRGRWYLWTKPNAF